MHPCNLQCYGVTFLRLFLIQRVCLCHLSDVRPYVSSSTFLFFGSCVWVLHMSILKMATNILQGGLPRWLKMVPNILQGGLPRWLRMVPNILQGGLPRWLRMITNILQGGLPWWFRMAPNISEGGLPRWLFLRWVAELGFEKLSRSFEILFSYFFFHPRLFDDVNFQNS